jgi:arginyl-tRNA synthetase
MIEEKILNAAVQAVKELYSLEVTPASIQLQKTRREFKGDLTIVVFPYTRSSKKSPEATAEELGKAMLERVPELAEFTVVKGFLNLVVRSSYWLNFVNDHARISDFGIRKPQQDKPWLIEFSSPNTNKPLHLGHIRNNLLGWSVSRILEAAGKMTIRVNLVNDRGIHICKSMWAWKQSGNNETPANSGKKGDHLVGEYYVLFDKIYKAEISDLVNSGMSAEEAAKQAPSLLAAQEMLRQWEAGDQEVRELWEMMNSWVYAGFDDTYRELGIDFHKTYYESQTYLLGKSMVEKGLADGILRQKEDGSVWADLTQEGLDEKLLLRSDGTSVYMTQDLGTARLRYEEYKPEKMLYVVGNEQNYHFSVLEKVLAKLGYDWAPAIHHVSYGMVELPEGKMKSREGTVVDADDLMEEMQATARRMTEELGKTEGFSEEEAAKLYHTIGLGALKYFILKVDPEKNMLFNPEESVDFDGNTGPFIQYTHARICSLLKRGNWSGVQPLSHTGFEPLDEERDIIRLCHDFPQIVEKAAAELSPAQIANYVYELTRAYNTFYQKVPVLKEEQPHLRDLRLMISALTATVIRLSMNLLGIDVPEKM